MAKPESGADPSINKSTTSSLLYSFYSDDSYDLIKISKPELMDRQQVVPKGVPGLTLEGLPEYETSSDEEGGSE